MLRTDNRPLAFRTLKPLYEHRIATPFAPVYLTENYSYATSGEIWPGMVAAGPIGQNPTRVRLATRATDSFFGLFAHNHNSQIDELHGGTHVTAVWYGVGSCWKIFSPAYNTEESYAVPNDGTEFLLTWDDAGRLCPADSGSAVGGQVVAKLIGAGTNFIEVQLIAPEPLA